MKRIVIGAGIFLAFLFVVWVVGRIAGFGGWYNIPSPANEPGIETGSKIFAISFKKPDHYNFVVYRNRITDSLSYMPGSDEEMKANDYVHRLCGMPGDILEMKNSVLYINGKNFDDKLDTKGEYVVCKKDFDKINKEDFLAEKGEIRQLYYSPDTMIISLDKKLRKKYRQLIPLIPYYYTDPALVNSAFEWNDKDNQWTVDNFGPLRIPADSCFVMGDNRHNSLDSRYTGFVAMKDISGVVINK